MVEHLISDEEKGEKETRSTCKADLEEVNKSDDNFPIVLDKMKFNVFSYYMSTKKSKKYRQQFSDTSYGGVLIPLTHLYHMSGNIMYEE